MPRTSRLAPLAVFCALFVFLILALPAAAAPAAQEAGPNNMSMEQAKPTPVLSRADWMARLPAAIGAILLVVVVDTVVMAGVLRNRSSWATRPHAPRPPVPPTGPAPR